MQNRSRVDSSRMIWVTKFMHEIEIGLIHFQKAYFEEHGQNMEEKIIPFSHD